MEPQVEPNGAAAIGLTAAICAWLLVLVAPQFALLTATVAFFMGLYGRMAATGKGLSVAAMCVSGALVGIVVLVAIG